MSRKTPRANRDAMNRRRRPVHPMIRGTIPTPRTASNPMPSVWPAGTSDPAPPQLALCTHGPELDDVT
jgi:hypothetical protein